MTARLAWVDLETTGLSPDRDVILEVGIMITDGDLNWLGSHQHVVQHNPGILNFVDADAWVRKTHADSGLLNLVLVGTPLSQVEDILVGVIEQTFPDTQPPMCGSSVHFDRAFLARHMPRLEAKFHYRNIDISTLKELAKLWQPDLDSERDLQPLKRHRVMDDLDDTIGEAKYYRDRIFGLS